MATNNQLYGVNNQHNPDQTVKASKPYTTHELAEKYGETYTGGAGSWNTAGRTGPKGSSQADESFLSDGEYAIVQQLREQYSAAQAAGDRAAMNAAHAEAERVRARYGYSGGDDGSQYINTSGDDEGADRDARSYGRTAGGGRAETSLPEVPTIAATGKYAVDTAALKSMLEQWKAAAVEQRNNAVDHSVQKAVEELERALEDAQPQFREQAESVARDERQGMDNAALYAELRGDKGGIGQGQYNEVQAAAAKNRLAVQQAQTKLSTDTARQIAGLRAQGEFNKADAALQISQSYLSQLMDLEKWAQSYNLSAAEFETSLQQWQANYELSLVKLQADIDQSLQSAQLSQQRMQLDAWQSQLTAAQAARKAQLQNALEQAQLTGTMPDGTLTVSARNQLISMGKALLDAGIMPGESQLAAMGMTGEQARAYILRKNAG